jgi:hypothetical protein
MWNRRVGYWVLERKIRDGRRRIGEKRGNEIERES